MEINRKVLFVLVLVSSILISACSSQEAKVEIYSEKLESLEKNKYNVTEHYIEAGGKQFSKSKLEVSQGDLVKIEVSSTEGYQDFIIEELNVDSYLIPEGESKVVEFVVQDKGEYEYFSSVRSNKQKGMVGTLVVK